jgi:endoglucanase
LSGPEFGRSVPGRFNVDYTWPSVPEIATYGLRGAMSVRLPFRWERLQPILEAPFDAAEAGRLDAVIGSITDAGMIALLDPHNYGFYQIGENSYPIGSAQVPTRAFTGFWAQLAEKYRRNPRVWFGLMNEPHQHSAEAWREIAQAATDAIRATGATNKILVPGTAWTGAHSWISSGNGAAMARFSDPANNFAFEVHQYLDADSSGTSGKCVDGAGTQRLQAFEAWLRSLPSPAKGFLGEFAGGDSSVPGQENCAVELRAMLEHIDSNSDVWLGWTVWGGGSWWAEDYPFRLEARPGSPETNLMQFYRRYFGSGGRPPQAASR